MYLMGFCLLLSLYLLFEASELGIKRFRYFMMIFKFQSYCQKLDHWYISLDFPGGSDSKVSACNAGDPGSIPGSGRFPGEGNGYPLHYSCLENSMDRRAWWATVHGVAKSRTRLSDEAHSTVSIRWLYPVLSIMFVSIAILTLSSLLIYN